MVIRNRQMSLHLYSLLPLNGIADQLPEIVYQGRTVRLGLRQWGLQVSGSQLHLFLGAVLQPVYPPWLALARGRHAGDGTGLGQIMWSERRVRLREVNILRERQVQSEVHCPSAHRSPVIMGQLAQCLSCTPMFWHLHFNVPSHRGSLTLPTVSWSTTCMCVRR